MTNLTPATTATPPVQVGADIVYCPPGFDMAAPSLGLKGHDYALALLESAKANKDSHDDFVIAMHVLKEGNIWKSIGGYKSYNDLVLREFDASPSTAHRWAVQGKEIWAKRVAAGHIAAGGPRSRVTDSGKPLGLERPSKGGSISGRKAVKMAAERRAAAAAADEDIIDAEIVEDVPTPPAPKAIDPPKAILASVPDIPTNPIDAWEDPAPPAPVQDVAEERAEARGHLDALLDWLGTLDAAKLAAVATQEEGAAIVRFAYAFTAMADVKPKAARKAPAPKTVAAVPDKLASGVGAKKPRNGDPVDPRDCKHPVNRRVGTMCSACRGTVK